MRRLILAAAVAGLFSVPAVSQADQWGGFHHGHTYGPGNLRWYGAPQGGTPPGWSYGRRLRGGFGCNGYAPICGPLQGPEAYAQPIDPNWQPGPPVPHLPRGVMPDMGFPHELIDPIELGARRSSATTATVRTPTPAGATVR